MYFFSPEFIEGLETKSEGFQNKFYEIIDEIGIYLDDIEDEMDFQGYIEENHSFSKPGNIYILPREFSVALMKKVNTKNSKVKYIISC